MTDGRRMIACLCASPLDLPQGLELAKLWADIEPEMNYNVDIAIALRYDMDTATIPEDIIARLKEKFQTVHVFKSPLVGRGWPHGCNALEIGAYQWFVEATRRGALDSDYIFIVEPDTVPLRPTWLDEIRNEAYNSGGPVIGAYFTAAEGCQHINGNCVMHKDFWKDCREIWNVPPGNGWDVYIGKKTTALGKPSKLIWQDYRLGAPDNPWKNCSWLFEEKIYHGPNNPLYGQKLSPCFLHGVKTLQGIECIRERFNLPRIATHAV
jgi:hypothetical protein